MTNSTKPRALSRTWQAHTTYRECSVVTGTATYTVTLNRTADGFTATVDGQPMDVLQADRILRAADKLEVIAETLDTPPTIGNAAGCAAQRAGPAWASAPIT